MNQDLTELDRESAVKPGKARSEAKVKAIEKRLVAASADLDTLAKFYK